MLSSRHTLSVRRHLNSKLLSWDGSRQRKTEYRASDPEMYTENECACVCMRVCLCLWICWRWSNVCPLSADYTIPSGSKLIGAATFDFALIMTTSTRAALAWTTHCCQPTPFWPLLCTPTPHPQHTYTGQCQGKRGKQGEGDQKMWEHKDKCMNLNRGLYCGRTNQLI